ncbi:hypothetical protein DY78_GL000356 [Lactiplantibacillus fabifermentans DSM 21115]|uniref:Uncharacterized protein n=1 Tax=Lactiplantibacillus fabifermentans DSM 21115 TaxID=1413187 RepID=A0A0R2NQR8_9LACO|nr:hypothetical protein DY78_GL000356 [Lactiplantibacillus fabifermentans DSM 21115]
MAILTPRFQCVDKLIIAKFELKINPVTIYSQNPLGAVSHGGIPCYNLTNAG